MEVVSGAPVADVAPLWGCLNAALAIVGYPSASASPYIDLLRGIIVADIVYGTSNLPMIFDPTVVMTGRDTAARDHNG